MRKFRVIVPEVYFSHFVVEAETADEAAEMVEDGEVTTPDETVFGYTVHNDTIDPWEITEEPNGE